MNRSEDQSSSGRKGFWKMEELTDNRNISLLSGDEEEEDEGNGEGNPYQFVPVSLTEMQGGNERVFFVKNEMVCQSEEVESDPKDYQYSIDNSTGNLLIMQDAGRNQVTSRTEMTRTLDFPSSSSTLSRETLALLQALDDGQCVLETSSDQITFHSAEVNNSQSTAPNELEGRITYPNTENHQLSLLDDSLSLRKVCQWSKRKVADFIVCIQNHEQKFKKGSKLRVLIWNDIAQDMFALGHRDCNKDECCKKFSNLYRTWKIVKSRSKEARKKWQYFDQVTNIVRFITQRVKKSAKLSNKDLIKQLMERNLKYKQDIRIKEEEFQVQVSRLDTERDDLLNEIGKLLEK